jgi:methyl-galactoside transport system substrate-binding protein
MKKLLILLTAVMMCVSLAACSDSTDTTTDDGAATIKVGVAIYQFNDNFMTYYREELERYFAEDLSTDEVTYDLVVTDGKNDQAEQTNQIDNFIAQGYDALIINLVQSSSSSTMIDKCAEAGIPCLFINRQPTDEDMASQDGTDYEGMFTYVGADARQSGKIQGKLIADLDDMGDLNGDGVLSYIMIQGDPENIDAQYRTEFSISEYEALTGLETNLLDLQRGDWDQQKGQEIASNDLTQFGDEIEVIFCNNDGMALGAAQAIKSAGRVNNEDIYLVGVDAIPDAISKIQAGEMTGTVLNDYIGQAQKVADLTLEVLAGTKLDKVYMVDYQAVTE